MDPSYWEQLAVYYSEENHETNITQDNVSCVKSICEVLCILGSPPLTDSLVQILEDEPFEALRPTMEALIANKDQDKQRAAAEFIAGVVGGT